MALPEELAFFFLLDVTVLVGFVAGVLALLFGEAVVDGAAIFELDLALLDPGFLDFELSQDRLGAGQRQPRRRDGGNRHSKGQVLQLSL